MNEIFDKLLNIFYNNKHILAEKGWIVSSPYSYEWWGGLRSAEEIIISSILVQMTKWETVKRAIDIMREKDLTDFKKLYEIDEKELYSLLRGINFYKTKAKRLKRISEIIINLGSLEKFYNRELLLSIEGIGQETADSILLFAGHKLSFPPSEYGNRVLSRVLNIELRKNEVKSLVENNLDKDVFKYKLFHAGLVTTGRAFCFSKPKCENCILNSICKYSSKTT